MATYAFSDLHGDYQLWTAIKNYCKDDDILFFLGDVNDRGNDGIKILQEMIDDPRIIYILGNHEDMLLGYIEDGLSRSLQDKTSKEIINANGSLPTIQEFQKLNYEERQKIIDFLKNKTFIKYIYNNKEKKKIVLCHAGCNSKHINGEYPIASYIWDRNHIKTKEWDINYEDYIVVHGHTPVQYLNYLIGGDINSVEVKHYCGNHKIDIDMGCFESNRIALLNLDNFEVIYFTK